MIKKLAGIIVFSSLALMAAGQDTETEPKKKYSRPDIPGIFTVELGINRARQAPNEFNLGFWGARTLNIYYQYELRILKSRFSLVPGLGVSLERFKFTNFHVLRYPDNNTDSVILVHPSQLGVPGIRKTQLITNYIDLPVELRYSSRPDDPNRSFKAAIGGRVGYLYDAFSKVKYKENGEIKQIKDKQNFNLNRLRYGVYGKIGIGNFSVVGYYNLSSLFKEDKGFYESGIPNNFNTFTIGISLASF